MRTVSKKVVLCYPIVEGRGENAIRGIPLSLLFLASPLLDDGFEVVIVDGRLSGWEEKLKREAANAICVGISCFVAQVPNTLEFARLIRENYAELPIVLGGWYPTTSLDETISSPLVDIIVRGEGEESFFDLCTRLYASKPIDDVEGITYKIEGKVINNPDRKYTKKHPVYKLPYDLLDPSDYELASGRALIVTSRGCPYKCAYCTMKTVYNQRWKSMTVEDVLDNIEHLYKAYNITEFQIDDDNFFVDRKRVKGILEGILKRKMDLTWTATGNILDLQRLERDIYDLAKETGCFKIRAGVETASPHIMDVIDKEFDVTSVIDVARVLTELDIEFRPNFILGIPGENRQDLYMTLDMVKRLIEINPKKHPIIYIYQPVPSTKLYYDELEDGAIKEFPDFEGWSSFDTKVFWGGVSGNWSLGKDIIDNYRVEERDKVRMISFYFKLAYMDRKRNRNIIKKALKHLTRRMARFRYNSKFFAFPIEWHISRSRYEKKFKAKAFSS